MAEKIAGIAEKILLNAPWLGKHESENKIQIAALEQEI